MGKHVRIPAPACPRVHAYAQTWALVTIALATTDEPVAAHV
jgi:hypothetical protein